MENKTPKYTTIIHKIRIQLDLTCNEYCVADIIFSLSNNPDAGIKGWCYATKETIASFMGLAKANIYEIINRLIEKGLVEKDLESKFLKTTSLWYQSVVLERLKMKNIESPETGLRVLKQDSKSPETGLKRVLKQDSYNNKDNNNNNISYDLETKSSSNQLTSFIEEVVKVWNSCAKQYPELKNTSLAIKGLPICKKVTPDIERVFKKLTKEKRTLEDAKSAINNYMKDIQNRKIDKTGYAFHRFSFFKFFKQENGFITFLNQ